jgi:hypothetical protein
MCHEHCLRPLVLLAMCVLAAGCTRSAPPPSVVPATKADERPANLSAFCSACHAFPPPGTFPRSAWRYELEQAYRFFSLSLLDLTPPKFDEAVHYFETHAPDELPPAHWVNVAGPAPVDFERIGYRGPAHAEPPAVSNVNLVHLFHPDKLDVLTCDMRRGQVMALSPYEEKPSWKVLAHVPHPAHAEVVDLDKDGVADILVANLGSFRPTDALKGSVVWLRGSRDGRFTPVTLLGLGPDGKEVGFPIGRVADVQPADFNGDGKLDLVVAVFGWNETGEIYWLENKTEDWSKPHFEPHRIDERHGAIHVPVADLNRDGKPDFVALISQEHETIVAFLNDGKGNFRKETIFTADHPGYGSSGIELVDLNGDGKLDVLYTNGDTLDKPYLLKPYHGVQWLENNGGFPFTHHPLTPLYGVHRAVAADVDGDGLLDVVAVSFLPEEGFPQRKEKDLDAVILLRQIEPGRFERYRLEGVTCDHVTCVAGDIFHTGRADFVSGNFLTGRDGDSITVWRNRGKTKLKR